MVGRYFSDYGRWGRQFIYSQGTPFSFHLRKTHPYYRGVSIAIIGSQAISLKEEPQFEQAILLRRNPTVEDLEILGVTSLISFGHSEKIPRSVLEVLGNKAVNVHISLLPWNRGSDPNFWSWLTGTPKGVTLHAMSEGIDEGPIWAQASAEFGERETLRSSTKLVVEHLNTIRFEEAMPSPQPSGGSHHSKRDLEPFRFLLRHGWDTTCEEIARWGAKQGLQ